LRLDHAPPKAPRPPSARRRIGVHPTYAPTAIGSASDRRSSHLRAYAVEYSIDCEPCGGEGQRCCPGEWCGPGLGCDDTCEPCGLSGEPCCRGETCITGTCNGSTCP
ncbi:MAG: hypothetical protein JW751_28140, partial [Polyangiaceae bacterium]|nr:hypothetical protein [Polyangiaceae bacterium]